MRGGGGVHLLDVAHVGVAAHGIVRGRGGALGHQHQIRLLERGHTGHDQPVGGRLVGKHGVDRPAPCHFFQRFRDGQALGVHAAGTEVTLGRGVAEAAFGSQIGHPRGFFQGPRRGADLVEYCPHVLHGQIAARRLLELREPLAFADVRREVLTLRQLVDLATEA